MNSPISLLPNLQTPQARTSPAATGMDATAQKFETMAIAQFLKPIFATMGKADAPFGGGSVEKQFQPFLIDAIAKSMEARGGLGLTPMIAGSMAGQSAAHTSSLHPTPAKGTQP